MPEPDLEALRRKILEDLEQVELALKREQQEDHPKPTLRLLKGGLVGGAIWSGIEWLRTYKRIGVALVAAGITIGAAGLAEQDDGFSGADPPPSQHTTESPNLPTTPAKARATPPPGTPPRTSPLRTLGTKSMTPETTTPSAAPQPPPRSKPPRPTPTLLATPTSTPAPVTVTPPVTVPTTLPTCPDLAVGDLLEVKLCLPGS